jgi:hypothetical protein
LLSQPTRQLALYAFLAGSVVYLFYAVFRPLWLPVNPYYAARQVERQLPHAKNSLINWVDLHEQPLPPPIHKALSQRAAKDLAHVDLDQAISGRRAAWVGGLAGLFAVLFFALYFLIGPAPFLSLLKRTFNPFKEADISTRTRLRLLKPEGGDVTLTVGQGINFVVEVGGKVPDPKAMDAVKLLYRYEESDPWLERRLTQEPSGEWTTSLSALDVKNGLWYKITGGDAATEEHRIRVRAAPAITDFLATYRFRPYVARADEVRRQRELKALRGTEVLLRVRTNRLLREGRLELEGNRPTEVVKPFFTSVRGEGDAKDPQAFLVRFVLDEEGRYRLLFTSTEGETYSDPVSYPVTVIPDQPPVVELTKPGKDVRLPVNALLHLEGKANDDIGVRSLTLRMRVLGGDKLRDRPYRSDEQLRLADGGYPRELEYKDFVDLSRVQSEDNRVVPLRSGMELEYWLEASDACDYPRPNIAESKHYRILLTDPEKNDPKKEQEKKQAEKEKKQHEQKQDQKLQKENQERRQQRQEQETRNKEEESKSKNADKDAAGKQAPSKEGGQGNNSQGKENNGQQGESKAGPSEPNSDEQKGELSKEEQSIEERIKKALEKREAGKDGKGEAKPAKGDAGQGKEAQKSTSPEHQGQGDDQSANGRDQQPKGADGRRDDGKTETKSGDSAPKSKQPGQNENKPEVGQNKDAKKDKGENKRDKYASSQSATDKDIADLANALKSQDARKRAEAKRELQRLAQEAADLKAREKAAQALRKAGESDAPPDNKAPKKGNDPSGQSSDERKQPHKQQGEKSEKPNNAGPPNNADLSNDKSNGQTARPEQKNSQTGKDRKGASPAEGPPGPPTSPKSTPGGGGDRRDDPGGPSAPPPQPKPPDKPRDHRAAQMQLEDFAKRVNKDILKEAGVSEEAWKKYLDAKRKQLMPRAKPRPEVPSAPQQASQLPSMGGRAIQPSASGQSDASSPDRGQPPPGYRDAFREFTREMSQSK